MDCKTGKYTIIIDKFDDYNLDELPLKLHPSHFKQVRVSEDVIAYQSEHAPFSNFFPGVVSIGQHKFFCLEQAYQFLKSKIMNKPLIGAKIYLSRDVHYIKRLGDELGTSEEWARRQFNVMYECLMKKFQQNSSLKALLLKTGNLQLVEATPNRLWGCGSTLSSNVIRRRGWPGRNKHSDILMTVRDELRKLDSN